MSKFRTQSGKIVDLAHFRSDMVNIEDIAHHLAKIQRFNGAHPIDVSYTVGEHCINLVQYALFHTNLNKIDVQMLLLHDASEAYLSDIVSPAKKLLPDYVNLEDKVEREINSKYLNINVSISDRQELKELDRRIMIDEVQHIMPEKFDIYKEQLGIEPLGCYIHFNNHPATIRQVYLTLAKKVGII